MEGSLITWGLCTLILALGTLAWWTFRSHRQDFREHKSSVGDKLDGLRERQAQTHTSVEKMGVQMVAETARVKRHSKSIGRIDQKTQANATRLTQLEARNEG